MIEYPYDRAQALIDGRVKPEGIDLDIDVNPQNPGRRIESPAGKFDIVEFYTGLYIADLPYKELGYTAIPIFVKRMFRHSYIYINKRAGIQSPTELNGRRVGVQVISSDSRTCPRHILDYEIRIPRDMSPHVPGQQACPTVIKTTGGKSHHDSNGLAFIKLALRPHPWGCPGITGEENP